MDLDRWLSAGVAAIGEWEAGFGAFARHPSLQVSDEQFAAAFGELTERLRGYTLAHGCSPACPATAVNGIARRRPRAG